MNRTYKNINKTVFSNGEFSIVPIRDADKFEILKWRNEQIEILRQENPLTMEDQEKYFKDVIDNLFEIENPKQLLFSFLERGNLIGYGGLVHIDWSAKHGEISFLLSNEYNSKEESFKQKWSAFLTLLTNLAFKELHFHKIHTYAYNIREYYFEVMYRQDFKKEGQLKDHVKINNKLIDVIILSKFNV